MSKGLEHIVRFERGHDCIRFECIFGSKRCKPGAGGSHGRHGLQIRFVVKGNKGAVQFLLHTDWLPQYTEKSSIGSRDIHDWGGEHVIPVDLGYHAKEPQYDGQEPSTEACEFCDGEPCYYDGSALNANDAMYALVNGGGEALWAFLDAYYECRFNGGEYPEPAEYEMPPRRM